MSSQVGGEQKRLKGEISMKPRGIYTRCTKRGTYGCTSLTLSQIKGHKGVVSISPCTILEY
jgi:hypothetical protein